MSNDLTVLQSNVPAHLQNNTAAAERNAGALAGTGGGGVDRISLKQSRFRIIEGGEEVAKLDASALNLVLLRVNDGITKTYYEDAWNPSQEAQAPTCYSDNGVVPSPNADKPQAQTCAECPHSAWGSKINPNTKAESKECSDSKRIAVVAAGDVAKKDVKTYQLSVPAASLKDFGKYVRQLNALSPAVPYNALVTQVAFDTDATYPKLLFSPVRYLSTDEFNAAETMFESEKVKLCAGLAEAAAQHARRAAAGSNIPGQNPAAAAQQAVRDQGQAAAESLSTPAQGAQQGQQQAQGQTQQQNVQTPPTNDAAADSFGSTGGGETQAPAQPAPEQKVDTPPPNAAESFGSAPTQEPAPEPQPEVADSFGAEAPPAQEPAPQQADTSGFGDDAPAQAQQTQAKPAAKADLDSVFGEGWDD